MRKLFFLILLIMPLAVLAQEEINPDIGFGVENPQDLGIESPKKVSYLDLEFTESGVFEIDPKGSTLKELELELFSFPREDYYQKISDFSTSPEVLENRDSIFYSWESLPAGDTEYQLTANIKLDFDIKKQKLYQPFPFTNIPEEYNIYLEPTEKINSDDPNIKRVANEIILGEDDAYKVAYRLAKFVNEEMTYDLDYLGRIESSSVVLNDKTGVCVEYSNLFIALARSVGMPARYVSGYAYGNVYGEKFNAHAWTEIYLPNIGWIPFDTTFGEFGWVDMTHIKTQLSTGPEEPSLKYQWIGGDVSTGEPIVDVELNQKEENLPSYVVNNIWVEQEALTPGSFNVVWMSIENIKDFYIIPEASLTASPKIIGKNQKTTVLAPGESKTIGWIIQVPTDLDPGFTYTYTVEGEVLFGEKKSVVFTVDPRSDEDLFSLDQAKFALGVEIDEEVPTGLVPSLNINLQSPEVAYLNEDYNVVVKLYNSGNAPFERLSVCVEDASKQCETVFLGINDRQTLTFTKLPGEVGTKTLFVTVSGEEVEESQIVEVNIVKKDLITAILEWIEGVFGAFFSPKT